MPGKALHERAYCQRLQVRNARSIRSSEEQVLAAFTISQPGVLCASLLGADIVCSLELNLRGGFDATANPCVTWLVRRPTNPRATFSLSPNRMPWFLRHRCPSQYRLRGIAVALIYLLAVETHGEAFATADRAGKSREHCRNALKTIW
jgi:hypothetical protein